MDHIDPVADEGELRVQMAALFRLLARLGLHEAVANHCSAVIAGATGAVLINPKWRHFSRIRASDLVRLEFTDGVSLPPTIDPTAWAVHSRIHARLERARVVIHLHPIHATALSSLADPTLLAIDQNSARYFRRIAVDDGFSGMVTETSEGDRLAAALGVQSRLIMRNHGVIVLANNVGEAFDDIYTLERACQVLAVARASGQPLNILPDDIAERTARDWEAITDFSRMHFDEMVAILDADDPSFRE